MQIDRPFPRPGLLDKWRSLGPPGGLDAANLLDRYTDAFGDRPMLFTDREAVFGQRRSAGLGYAEVRDLAGKLASVWADLPPGSPVAVFTANRVELAVAVLGAWRAGLVAVPLGAGLTPREVASAVERSGARAVVVDAETAERAVEAGVGPLYGVDDHPAATPLREFLEQAPVRPPVRPDPKDPALLIFTSGTTGEPKAATISHRALASVVRRYARVALALPTPAEQLILLVMPMAHTGGFITLLTTACLGAPSLIVSRFEARRVLDLIERARPSVFAGTPAMYRLLLEGGAEGYDLSSIRIWGGGADVFHRELLDRLRDLGGWRRLGVRFKPFTIIGYGASETTGPVTISPPVPVGERCIGWVLPGFDYRIVDERGEDVARGEPGELILRGGSLMSGYWEDRRDGIADGWFRTGDVVRRGRVGLLYYEGRRRDVIKTGGYSVPAREIEQVLESHPSVAAAAAVGLPDPVKGEHPAAVVVLRAEAVATPDELHSWADERLAPYKRPRQIYLADEIPLTASMKPRKQEIRDMLTRAEGGT